MDVADRVVIITGGGRGIGRAYAHNFAKLGAIPVIAEIDRDSADTVVGEIESAGGKALAIPTDVASEDSVANMVETTMRTYGRIDALVNNAAVHVSLTRLKFYEMPYEEWESVIRLNLGGVFLCSKAVAPAMIEAGWGRIINISSDTVDLAIPLMPHYVTSKAAIIGLTRVQARELGEHGITVNSVLPGLTPTEVDNPYFDDDAVGAAVAHRCINRNQVPDDLVGMVAFLVSPAAGFITGQAFTVNGGITFR